MNARRLARRNARLCPMLGNVGRDTEPGFARPIDLVDVGGIRTVRCFGPRHRRGGGITIRQLAAIATGMGAGR